MIDSKNWPEIVDLDNEAISRLLERVNFGHLGLSRKDIPYVVPIHFGYREPRIYFFTTEGMKTDILDENPAVCLQVEDIKGPEHWQSVVVTGRATRLTDIRETDMAIKLIKSTNPRLVPAWSIRWLDDWVRSTVEVVYRIDPEKTSGRTTLDRRPKLK